MTAHRMLAALASLTLAAAAQACTPEEEDRIAYSSWNYASPAGGGAFPYIAYEIRRTGFHSADVHFKNFAKSDIAFAFWLPGFPMPEACASVRVPVSAPTDREWIVPIVVDSGTTGLRFSQLKMSHIKLEGQTRTLATGVHPAAAQPLFPADEAWMSIVPGQTLVEFSGESAACRVVHDAAGTRVLFRNTSRENVYFDFVVMGYQTAGGKLNRRVSLAAGQQQSVPVKLDHCDTMLPLARVKAFDIRINGDSGVFLDEKDAEEGWFAVSAVNCPNINPNQIVYRIDKTRETARIRFKNISRQAVHFKYGIASLPMLNEIQIAPESETAVTVAMAANALPALLTRVRVCAVGYDGTALSHK